MQVINSHLTTSIQHIKDLVGHVQHVVVNYEENELTRVRTVNHAEASFDKAKLPMVRKALVNAFGECSYQPGLKERALRSTAVYRNDMVGYKMTVRLRVYSDVCTISFAA